MSIVPQRKKVFQSSSSFPQDCHKVLPAVARYQVPKHREISPDIPKLSWLLPYQETGAPSQNTPPVLSLPVPHSLATLLLSFLLSLFMKGGVPVISLPGVL